jgi:hypothetical protein
MRRGHERKRWDNDFAGQISRANGNLQRCGGVAHGNAVADAGDSGNSPLKFLHLGAIIGQPAALQNIAYTRQQLRLIAHVWSADMKTLGKERDASKDPEVVQRRFDR